MAPTQLSLDGLDPSTSRRYSLFFALRPDAPAADRAHALATTLAAASGTSGRADRKARFHVTLCHVGYFADEVPASVLKAAREAAAQLSQAPAPSGFTVSFDRVGSFSGKPGNLPVVLRGAQACAGLMAYQARLDQTLLRAGLIHGERHAQFTPHLTLFYGRQPVAEQSIEPIAWRADHVVLYRSVIGESRYEEEGVWPLSTSA